MNFRIWRGDKQDGALKDVQVEVNEGEVVLDVIHRIQATQMGDLAVRWNCKAGKCGSCSMEINGKPRLACMTRMSTFEDSETVTITPLRAFPVIRDLVTDVSFNYEKAREIPSFTPPADSKPGDFRMQQMDVERSQEFRKCIECYMCQNVCHVIRDHEENKKSFAGPRYLMRMAELDMHPLDTRRDRKELAQDEHGLGFCNITKCCTEVCPEHIKITDNALIPMKERVVDMKYDPVRWNCKAGKCGSCSMEINGKPRLACMTRMSTFEDAETVTITPLRAFPVIRDLVTDVSFNYEKAREIPSFTPPADSKPGDFRMAQVDVERSQEFRKCIECYMCQNVCHVIRDHEENKKSFAGPRYLMRMAELDMHPLDQRRDRKDLAQDEHGLGFCNITKCCTEVCPEHIKITDNALIPLKERVVDMKYDPIRWLGSKILKREDIKQK